MNHLKAADIRDSITYLDSVDGVEENEDATPGDADFRLATVNQPGYANGAPHYEVLLHPGDTSTGSVHIPTDVVDWVADKGLFFRIDLEDGVVHIRDGL